MTLKMALGRRAISAITLAFIGSITVAQGSQNCRYLPHDLEWPSVDDWTQLNASVSGRLIAVIPQGHVCHDPTYDAAACAILQESWAMPEVQ
jgi:hypothetical protein